MDDIVKLVSACAWPFVALIALLFLGPGGLLMRFAKTFGAAIGNFTEALPDIRQTSLTMKTNAEILATNGRDLAENFGGEVRKIEQQIELLSAKTASTLRELKDLLEEIDKSKVIESQQQIEKVQEELPELREEAGETRFSDGAEQATADDMWVDIRASWIELSDALRERLPDPSEFDGRMVGSIAWRLADGRRSNPISKEIADLVSQLHSQYKRFTRLAKSRDEWLTPSVFESFMGGLTTAINGLR